METLKEPIAHIARYGPRVAIYPRPGVLIPSYLFPSVAYNILGNHAGAFTVPVDVAHNLPKILSERYPNDRITIEPELANAIEKVLQTERQSFALSIATDADIPRDVLTYAPRDFQAAAIAYGVAQQSFLLSLDMGLGKTLVAIYLAEFGHLKTLWVTRAGLILNLQKEIAKQCGKKVCVFSGRFPTEQDYKAFLSGEFDHYIINYEIIGTMVKDENGKETRPWVDLFNMMAKLQMIQQIVADEAHACKNPTALRTQALLRLKASRRIPMTGTAIVNRLPELWTLLHWIAPERFPNQASFTSTHLDGSGRIKNPAALQKELAPYVFRRRKKDVIKDLPDLIRINHSVPLPPLHKDRYQKALAGVYVRLDESESEITNPLVELNRLRQIVADAKADETIVYIENLLEEDENAKVLVFSNFVDPARNMAHKLGCECIFENVRQHHRMEMMERFENDPRIRCLSLTVGVGGVGFNLTAATHVIFNDLAWGPVDHNQAIARAYGRLNNLHGATAVYVEIEDTVDAFMNSMIEMKQKQIDTVDGVTEGAAVEDSILKETIRWLRENRGNVAS